MSPEQRALAMDPATDIIESRTTPKAELKQFTDDFVNKFIERVKMVGEDKSRVELDPQNKNVINIIYEYKKSEELRKLLIVRAPLIRPLGENVTSMPTPSWTEYEIADPNSELDDVKYPHFTIRQSSDGETNIDIYNPEKGHISNDTLPSILELEKILDRDFLI